jgi:hypothetical protein
VLADAFSVYEVPAHAPSGAEVMGTKSKFWFARDGQRWLFKRSRPGQGEHWAEVLAAGLAATLGLPHADYQLARWQGESGVVSPNFVPADFDLVHGNELLFERDPEYPRDGARYIRTKQHTIDAVWAVLADPELRSPPGWQPPEGVTGPVDVFAGYLVLDAWIGNTDRHHENWGVLVRMKDNSRYLAPTFDHASSLGAHEPDQVRTDRLKTPDPAYGVEGYVQRGRARSALYLEPNAARPLTMVEACRLWNSRIHSRTWLARLSAIDPPEVEDLLGRTPKSEMSGPARDFVRAILQVNRRRILEER